MEVTMLGGLAAMAGTAKIWNLPPVQEFIYIYEF
jgi:hypothetical protein